MKNTTTELFEALRRNDRDDTQIYIFCDHKEIVCVATSFEGLYGKMYMYLSDIITEIHESEPFADDEIAGYFPIDEIMESLENEFYWEDDFSHLDTDEPEYTIAVIPKRVYEAIQADKN